MTKTKIAFAAALLAVSSSVALAAQQHRNVHSQSALQQREVALPSEPTQGNSSGPFWYSWSGPTKGGM